MPDIVLVSRIFEGSFFCLEVPEQWEEEIIEDIPCFYDLDGSGVLQLVATRNPHMSPYVLDDEIQRYLEIRNLENLKDRFQKYTNKDGLACAVTEFVQDQRFWLLHFMTLDDAMLLVQYNGDEVPDPELAKTISEVIQSVEFLV